MLYIIGYNKYKDYLENSIYKYLFKFYIPTFKAKRLGKIVEENEEMGYTVGINLRDIDYSNENLLNSFIDHILSIRAKEQMLFFEDINKIEIKAREIIETRTSMKIPTGMDIKLYNLPFVLRDIKEMYKRDIRNKEVLLISQSKFLAFKTIEYIADLFSFISLAGINKNEGDEIYREVLNKTGLSILQVNNFYQGLKKYDIIINLHNEPLFNINRIKREAIIFDFSESKHLCNARNTLVISDFSINQTNISPSLNPLIERDISSRLYECLWNKSNIKYEKVWIKDKYYDLKNYVEFSKIKGIF